MVVLFLLICCGDGHTCEKSRLMRQGRLMQHSRRKRVQASSLQEVTLGEDLRTTLRQAAASAGPVMVLVTSQEFPVTHHLLCRGQHACSTKSLESFPKPQLGGTGGGGRGRSRGDVSMVGIAKSAFT